MQDTAAKPWGSMFCGAFHEEPLNLIRSPCELTAMQNEAETHETDTRSLPESIVVDDHDVPLNFRALPFESTAIQNVAETHDTARSGVVPSRVAGVVQVKVAAPPADGVPRDTPAAFAGPLTIVPPTRKATAARTVRTKRFA